MDLVSVVIPTHYRPDRLKKAVDSVLAQSWQNLEVVVVSDGYDVQTESLMERLSKQDSRITFISYEKSQGGNHARNVGIQNTTGKYVAFLDDDDIWYPNKIEKQMQCFYSLPKTGIVGCRVKIVDHHNKCTYISKNNESGDYRHKILFYNVIGSTSCVILKKEALERCGVFDEELRSRQDYDLWIRICQYYEVSFVNEVLMEYNVYESTGNSVQVSKQLDKFIDSHYVLMKKYQMLYQHLDHDEYKKLLSYRYLSIAIRAWETGNISCTNEYSLKSLREYFSWKALFYYFFCWIPRGTLVRLFSRFH